MNIIGISATVVGVAATLLSGVVNDKKLDIKIDEKIAEAVAKAIKTQEAA